LDKAETLVDKSTQRELVINVCRTICGGHRNLYSWDLA